MTLHVYRSQRVEDLADALARHLHDAVPDDPFEPVPVVVGSRGMERWLRHELATRLGSAAALAFLFPAKVFDEASRSLLGTGMHDPHARAWDTSAASTGPWSGDTLVFRVLALVRTHLAHESFAAVRAYVGTGDAVGTREYAFAAQVASTVERMLHDRPGDVLAWIAGTDVPPEHAWLATLLQSLHAGANAADPSPAHTFGRLSKLVPQRGRAARGSFAVFGLGTLRPGDKLRLAALARHLDVHVFMLAPSSEWWADIRGRHEQRSALARASSDAERDALLESFTRNNTVLAANGIPSRNVQLWFEETMYVDEMSRQGSAGSTLLATMQSWIDSAGENPGRGDWSHLRACDSVQLHATHGALRQCEALRDELLRRFAHDPTLEPRHVLVMTPDVATYAPLVAAVFARQGTDALHTVPSIPVHVADLGLRATNPLADALLQALALAEARVTASALLDFLALKPVRMRFDLDDEDLADVRTMIVGAGIRWAWDASDRARHEQPSLDQNTVRFGLERLSLGVLMHDAGGLDVIDGHAHTDLGPGVPIDLGPRDRAERFGRLAAVCDTLQTVAREAAGACDARTWRDRLREMLEKLTRVDGDSIMQRVQVDDALATLLPDETVTAGGTALQFDRRAITSMLTGAFELPRKGDRPVTGAVTVCALEPMRSVPFRVVAVLGLDDGVFPRSTRTPAWDPFAVPRFGEYDRRTVDRHLFLEALLCARDALLLFGTGFEPKRGDVVPLSTIATEVLELLTVALDAEPHALLTKHPLQPWSARAFELGKQPPFDSMWAAGARAVGNSERVMEGLAATKLDATWPAEQNAARTITAHDLASALANAPRELLQNRLQLALDPSDTAVEDREPIETDVLDERELRDRVLKASEGEPDPERIEKRLRGEGALPLRAGGRRLLQQIVREAKQAREKSNAIGGEREEGAAVFRTSVNGAEIVASASDVRRTGTGRLLVWTTASRKPNERAQLIAWITLLTACASGETMAGAVVVGCADGDVWLAPPDDAVATLARLAAARDAAREKPVCLFPYLSRKVAEKQRDEPHSDPRAWVIAGDTEWEGAGRFRRGALQDPWVKALFGHLDIDELVATRTEAIVRWSESVWSPLLAAITDGGRP